MVLQKRKHDFRSTKDKRAEKRRLTVPSPVEDHAPSRTFMQFNSNKAHLIAYHKELYAKHSKQADKGKYYLLVLDKAREAAALVDAAGPGQTDADLVKIMKKMPSS